MKQIFYIKKVKKKYPWFFFLMGILLIQANSCSQKSNKDSQYNVIWVDEIGDDFSFAEEWSYPEGVYVNDFGQLSCDGFCPEGIENMKDEHGRIYDDSLNAFYQLVDTTHLYHTFQSETSVPGFGESRFMTAKLQGDEMLSCQSENNVSTHTSLNLIIPRRGKCVPIVIQNKISSGSGFNIMEYVDGDIIIDQSQWNQGILKAKFDYTFKNNRNETFFWRGKINTPIKNSLN